MVHHERTARALERLGILCYDVAKHMKECGCQETVFTNSLVGTKTGGRPQLAGIFEAPTVHDRGIGMIHCWYMEMKAESYPLVSIFLFSGSKIVQALFLTDS